MAQLLVRKLDDSLVQKLKERAAKNGVSAEEEHRRILDQAMNGSGDSKPKSKKSFEEFLLTMPNVGTDEDFARIEGTIRDVDLSD
ncbi:MAG: DNA-binding protein [Verrucomicrobia bacterium]|nr:DNA-binding protein [Verrucomicrobiota bacterium]